MGRVNTKSLSSTVTGHGFVRVNERLDGLFSAFRQSSSIKSYPKAGVGTHDDRHDLSTLPQKKRDLLENSLLWVKRAPEERSSLIGHKAKEEELPRF